VLPYLRISVDRGALSDVFEARETYDRVREAG
jgi:hypothetical protein